MLSSYSKITDESLGMNLDIFALSS